MIIIIIIIIKVKSLKFRGLRGVNFTEVKILASSSTLPMYRNILVVDSPWSTGQHMKSIFHVDEIHRRQHLSSIR